MPTCSAEPAPTISTSGSRSTIPTRTARWVFDVTFLTVRLDVHLRPRLPGRAHRPGARARRRAAARYGAHFIDEDDVAAVEQAASRSTDDAVAVPQEGRRKGGGPTRQGRRRHAPRAWSTAPASSSTARASPAAPAAPCTRPRWAAGERPLDWKPEVCWQLPLRLDEHTDDHGHVTSTLREWKRRDWGEGGDEFHWWCTDTPDAFVGDDPVYETLRDEIVEMVGEPVYELLGPPAASAAAARAASPTPPSAQR